MKKFLTKPFIKNLSYIIFGLISAQSVITFDIPQSIFSYLIHYTLIQTKKLLNILYLNDTTYLRSFLIHRFIKSLPIILKFQCKQT